MASLHRKCLYIFYVMYPIDHIAHNLYNYVYINYIMNPQVTNLLM